jgi:hypothetical protein
VTATGSSSAPPRNASHPSARIPATIVAHHQEPAVRSTIVPTIHQRWPSPSRRGTTDAVPARPLVLVLGVLLCLAAAYSCATAPANDVQAFPSRSDLLMIGGLALVVLGVAGREARGRQMLGRRPASPSAPAHDEPPPPSVP